MREASSLSETEQSNTRFCLDYTMQSEIFIQKYLRHYEHNLRESMCFGGVASDNV